MNKLTKNQKQIIVLSVVLAAIVVVLALYVFKPAPPSQESFTPPTLDSGISNAILKEPEYRRLSQPIPLPLVPGRTGRENPFIPYQ